MKKLMIIGFNLILTSGLMATDAASILADLTAQKKRIQTLEAVVTQTTETPMSQYPIVETYRLIQTPTHERRDIQSPNRKIMIKTPTATIEIDPITRTQTVKPLSDLASPIGAGLLSRSNVDVVGHMAGLDVTGRSDTEWTLAGTVFGLPVRLGVTISPVAITWLDIESPGTGLRVSIRQTNETIDGISVPVWVETIVQTSAAVAPIRSITKYRAIQINRNLPESVFDPQ